MPAVLLNQEEWSRGEMAALLKAPRSRVSAWLRSLEHDAPAISLRSHHVSLIMWDGIATPLTTNALKDFNTNRIDSGFNPLPSSTTDAVGEISKVLKFIRRHLFLLVAGLSFGGLLGFVYMLFQQPIYRATTTLEIQAVNGSFLNLDRVDPQAGSGIYLADSISIQTQLRELGSSLLIDSVVNKLQQDCKTVPITPKIQKPVWHLPIIKQQPTSVKEAIMMAAHTSNPRPLSGTRVIEITSDSTDPVIASMFLNTLVKNYDEATAENRMHSLERTRSWLSSRLDETKVKLQRTDELLQQFVRSQGLMFVANRDTLAQTKLRQLQDQLASAEADRIAKQSHFEMSVRVSPDVLPDLVNDAGLKSFQNELINLQRQEADLKTTFTSSHPKLLRIESQIGELRSIIQKREQAVIEHAKSDFEAARNRQQLLLSAYNAQTHLLAMESGRASEYNNLKRDLDVLQQTYNSLLQQLNQTSIATALPTNNIRVLDFSTPPVLPYKPKKVVLVGWGMTTGLFLAIAAALLVGRTRTVDEPGDSVLLMQLPELGTIPSIKQIQHYEGRSKFHIWRNGSGLAQKANRAITFKASSAVAESFRMTVATMSDHTIQGSNPYVLAVTSPGTREGKTTISSNLAISFAEANRKTLLIDGDLRRPRIHKVFQLENGRGLSDLLSSELALDSSPLTSFVRPTTAERLSVMTAGTELINVSSLLSSSRMSELLLRLRTEFEYIIIDTPPVLLFADAQLLARLSDGVVLVVRSTFTSLQMLWDSRRRLMSNNVNLLGAILNDYKVSGAELKRYYKDYERYHQTSS